MSVNNVIQEERGDCETDYCLSDLHQQSTIIQQPVTTGEDRVRETEIDHARDATVTSVAVDDQSRQSSGYEIPEVTTSPSYTGPVSSQTTSQHMVGTHQTTNALTALPVYDTPSQNQDRDVNVDPNFARRHYTGATNSRPLSSTSVLPSPFGNDRAAQGQTTRSSSEAFALPVLPMNSDSRPAQAQAGSGQDTTIMRHPRYGKLINRIQSFYQPHWPADHPVDRVSLALAGFFSLGNSDDCRCHFCGLNLHNWENGDDAFVEHARWSPTCLYLREYRGEAFVEAVQELAQLGERVTKEEVERKLHENSGLSQQNHTGHETIQQDPLPIGESQQEPSQESPSQQNPVQHQDEPVSLHQVFIQLRDREYNTFPEALFCRRCFRARVRVLLRPCDHLVLCSGCAPSCQRCPVCGFPIVRRVKVQLR